MKAIAKPKSNVRTAPRRKATRHARPAMPGTIGFLLDALDEVYPVPANLGPANRPYRWEHNTKPTDLVVELNGQTEDMGSAETRHLLTYWQNQSGGEGWGWKLGFADLREVIDFLCVVDGGMACDDEPMLDDDTEENESQGSGLRVTAWMRSLAAMRVEALRSRNLQPMIDAFNKGWGGIESID